MSDRASLPPARSDLRLLALDQLRGFIIVLVVLHHAILAYCTFGHIDRVHYALSTAPIVDTHRWVGFDLVVMLNDGFFMPLLFLLSGLFVPGGLARKTPVQFLRRRLLRLGLPFAVAELTLVPLAYYPSFLQAGGTSGFPAFWTQTITTGPWPSGPPWFIGILLLFDVVAALLFMLPRRALPKVITSGVLRPAQCFVVLLIVSILLYLPLLLSFGPARWVAFGPVAVQISRFLLYAAYFAAGVALGARGLVAINRFSKALASCWVVWTALALLTAIILVVVLAVRPPRWAGLGLTGVLLPAYCAAVCFAVAAIFVRFGGRPGPLWASLAANSFVIYLLHYPIVTWVQYALLAVSANAFVKGIATFIIALFGSWLGAVLLRAARPLAGRGS